MHTHTCPDCDRIFYCYQDRLICMLGAITRGISHFCNAMLLKEVELRMSGL